jgi:drug/metabolite transporter (DMT)-like permease
VSLVLFVLGLRHLGAARTGAYFSTAPFIGAVLALPLFGEPPTLPLIGAAAHGHWRLSAPRRDARTRAPA